jgi:hypothetical protein
MTVQTYPAAPASASAAGSASAATVSAPAEQAVKRLGRWRVVQVLVCGSAVALPLLRPAAPGNTGLADLGVLCGILGAALWAATNAYRFPLPYAPPVALTVLAGALAVVIADPSSPVAGHSLLALVQDIFVFAWGAAVATLGADHRLLDLFCKAWAYSTVAWAGLLALGELAGIDAITGIRAGNGIRAQLTLGDPNLAADYFLVGLLVIRATRRPRRTGWRWAACAVVVTGIVLTLSNGGILALVLATVAGGLFRLARRRGLAVAVAVAAVLALAGGAVYAAVSGHGLSSSAEQGPPVLRDSLGRESESDGSRSTLLQEGTAVWLSGTNLLGVGPGNTQQTLQARQAWYVKEAHDDYLAALLERGPLGELAVIILAASVAIRARRIARPGGIPATYREVVPRPELLGAAALAVAVSATLYETLHFRHVWALFGLIAALELAGRRERAGRRELAGHGWPGVRR